MTLTEGRTRQIRRMFELIGHPVSKLKRVAIGPIRDAALTPGAYRQLADAEVAALLRLSEEALSPLIVAIDGPSGAGKSTVARALAARLEVPYIDTGAMYRAVGLAAERAGVTLPIDDPGRVSDLAGRSRIELVPSPGGSRLLLDGEDVSEAIRRPEISLYASAVSAIPEVRRVLVAQQQRLGRERGGVLEGRDIGTKVFPETPHKFFLTAVAGRKGRTPDPGARRAGDPPGLRGRARGDGKTRQGRLFPGRFAPDPRWPVYSDRLDRPQRFRRRGRH